jgi:hypothetical protein
MSAALQVDTVLSRQREAANTDPDMQKRYLYALLFGIPGLFVTALLTAVLLGAAAGFLWLFVFGDSPWPEATQTLFPAAGLIVFLIAWVGIIAWGYRFGIGQEDGRPIDRRHLLIAAGAILLPIVIVILHQYRVGNLGPPSDGERCSDYCREQGYAASGMPARDSGDRSCICYDGRGREALTVPLSTIDR